MKYFRFPTRFLLVVNAALCALGGLGATALLARWKRELLPGFSAAALALVILVAADLAILQSKQNPVADARRWFTPPPTVERIRQDSTLFRIYSPGGNESHTMAFYANMGWAKDLWAFYEQRAFIQPSTNVYWGLSSADGYAQLTPSYVVDIWGDQNRGGVIQGTGRTRDNSFEMTPAFLRIISMFNVKYVLSPWRMSSDSLRLVMQSGPVLLYENLGVLPRAFVVGTWSVAPATPQAARILLGSGFDPSSQAIVASDPGIPQTDRRPSADAAITSYRSNEVRLRVQSDAAGLLVLSDTYYPGWSATVNGVPAPIIRANIAQRAIPIGAGEQEVRFSFEAPTVMAGLWTTIASSGVLAVLAVWRRRRTE